MGLPPVEPLTFKNSPPSNQQGGWEPGKSRWGDSGKREKGKVSQTAFKSNMVSKQGDNPKKEKTAGGMGTSGALPPHKGSQEQ